MGFQILKVLAFVSLVVLDHEYHQNCTLKIGYSISMLIFLLLDFDPIQLEKINKDITQVNPKLDFEAITSKVAKDALVNKDISLGEGLSGYALFFAYLDYHCQHEKSVETLEIIINRIFELIPSSRLNNLFYGGYTGLGWTLAHLSHMKILPSDEIEPFLSGIDDMILNELISNNSNYSLDIHYGLIGFGVYFLERNNEVGQTAIEKILQTIWSRRAREGGYYIWPDYTGMEIRKSKKTEYSLGFHYGISGINAFLLNCYKKNPTEKVKEMICSSLQWIQSQSWDLEQSFFPEEISEQLVNKPSSLAWRSSEIPLAIVLYKAGKLFDNVNFLTLSNNIISRACSRELEKSGITHSGGFINQGITYGICGTTLMFHYYHYLSASPIVKVSVDKWLNFLLRRVDQKNYFDPNQRQWVFDLSLSNGLCGQILSIISIAKGKCPDWGNCILLTP